MPNTQFDSPDAAEAAFYDAFERADIEAMMEVWASEGSVVCVHPMGERLDGRAAIESSWREILGGGSSMRFARTEVRRIGDERLSVHLLYEDISYGDGFAQRSRVIATNVYRLTDRGWKMVAHHASPGSAPGDAAADEGQTLH